MPTTTRKNRTYELVKSRQIFKISLIVIALTTSIVYLQGLQGHRSLFINSVLTTTTLAVTFFTFVVVGLYRGIKLKDDVGRITDRFKMTGLPTDLPSAGPFAEAADDIAGAIVGIILWILATIVALLLFWMAANVFLLAVLAFMAMLYWVFFRALRLVFKNSAKCKGDLITCMRVGLTYTALYSFWIYGVFFLVDYLIHR